MTSDPSPEGSRSAKFAIGDIVHHRFFPFRGVVYDVDPIFNHSQEWYDSIPVQVRPRKDQPFYHVLAENEQATYEAYVSEQNLVRDESGEPCRHPLVQAFFAELRDGRYIPRARQSN
jgi:heat shock protein HspQ